MLSSLRFSTQRYAVRSFTSTSAVLADPYDVVVIGTLQSTEYTLFESK